MGQRAPAFDLTQAQYTEIVTGVLRSSFANENKAAERLAVVAGCSPGTSKNWLDGTSTPNGLYLTRLRSAIPALAAELRRLEALDAEHDPEAQRLAVQLVQQIMRGR